MKKIKLNTKQEKPVYTLVDNKDYLELSKYNWYLKIDKKWKHNQYAVRFEVTHKNGKRKTKSYRMHRQILNASKGILCDHKNGSGLDNRRKNLRLCSFSENSQSCRSHKSSKTSKYKGVYWHKDKNKWQVRISYKGKVVYLGLYVSEMEAAHVHDVAAKISYGKFAVYNFKNLSEKHIKYVKKKLKSDKSKTSKYRGVTFYFQTNRWTAQISYNKVYYRLGYFATEKEAALAYNKKALELLGDKAILNKIR